MQKQLLLGVEAIAQGAIDSGISGVYAYPGTPSGHGFYSETEYCCHWNHFFIEQKIFSPVLLH